MTAFIHTVTAVALGFGFSLSGFGQQASFLTLHSFDGTNGATPVTGLVLSGSTLYGTAGAAIFKLNTDGSGFAVLNGSSGSVNTLLLSGNTLFGVEGGGLFRHGTVFKIDTEGSNFSILHDFDLTNGANPCTSLVLLGNTLYGMTRNSGARLATNDGFLFALGTDGTGFTNLAYGAFNPTSLILSGSTFYGTDLDGGLSDGGVFTYKFDTHAANDLVANFDLYDFSDENENSLNNDGSNPYSLIISGNTLYGTADLGGTAGNGTVFKVNTGGTGFATLHDFSATGTNGINADGINPDGGLALSGNTLYGTANMGGKKGNGTVFEVSTGGTDFATLHTFSATDTNGINTDGATPAGALTLSGNILYGTTSTGGAYGHGTVFALSLDGALQLHTQLALTNNGPGSVSGIHDGESVVINQSYTATAKPDPSYIFAGWTGTINSLQNPLHFKAQMNMTLEANFVTNVFFPAQGVYYGLFATVDGVAKDTTGMLKGLRVTESGKYSGTILIAGASHSISGHFDPTTGQATSLIPHTGEGPLLVALTLNLDGPPLQVTGTISGTNAAGAWTASLTAEPADTSLSSAEYTMVIPNDPSNTNSPGDGYAVIANNPAGKAIITGTLADGTAFSQSTDVSATGDVPVYVSLYGGKGLLLGLINLSDTPGSVTWIHPTVHSGLFKNELFTNNSATALSPWSISSNSVLTNLTGLSIIGALDGNDTNYTITTTDVGKVKIEGANPTVTGFVDSKGRFTVTIGSGADKVTGHGVILLNGPNGGGYFLKGTNAGAVTLQP
jgi:uncharacterized repeat protein (TIGR03803 family)